jgi:hypothetical protein
MTRCVCCDPAILGRRGFITGAATLGVSRAFANDKLHRIDIHHHIVPPTWFDALKTAGRDTPPVTAWTVQRSLDDMDKAGTATSIVSPTTSQVSFRRRVRRESLANPTNTPGN